MRIGSLFAGIGGFDLAARWMGWDTAWFSEIDPYASAVLAKHWPQVPNHGDITQIDFTQVEPVDMLCGGFPCQDISNAGKRKGIEGERSGLWSEYARAIGELRPRYVVVENVAALLGRGLERVLGDLAALGYDAEWTVLSAADVGAPHLRERLWIVAYPEQREGGERRGAPVLGRRAGEAEQAGMGDRGSDPLAHAIGKQSERERVAGDVARSSGGAEREVRQRERSGCAARGRGENRHALADAHNGGPQGREVPGSVQGLDASRHQSARSGASGRCGVGSVSDAERGRLQGGYVERAWAATVELAPKYRDRYGRQFGQAWWPEPDVGVLADGLPARLVEWRLRGLGNAIVPYCVLPFFQAIAEAEAVTQEAA